MGLFDSFEARELLASKVPDVVGLIMGAAWLSGTPGGGSSGPLRPQPASVNAAAAMQAIAPSLCTEIKCKLPRPIASF
jgi:hypothetical protein